MRDMSRRERNALDRFITGNFGEDQFRPWDCPKCGAQNIPAEEPCPECDEELAEEAKEEA